MSPDIDFRFCKSSQVHNFIMFQIACGDQSNAAFTLNDLQKDFFFFKLNQLVQKVKHFELILPSVSELQAQKRKDMKYLLDATVGCCSFLDHHPSWKTLISPSLTLRPFLELHSLPLTWQRTGWTNGTAVLLPREVKAQRDKNTSLCHQSCFGASKRLPLDQEQAVCKLDFPPDNLFLSDS